jgi:cell division septation protein DedD
MNTLLNSDRDEDVEDMHSRRGDREITLGTMTILGIFFALAVLCAGFFGFGYTTGRRTLPTPVAGSSQPLSAGVVGASKPSPFSSSQSTASEQTTAPLPVSVPATSGLAAAAPAPLPRSAPIVRETAADFDPDASVAGVPPRPVPVKLPVSDTPVPVTASPSVPGQFMVQVAAVSHPEDADLLVTTLKRVHYDVAVHHEPQDKLLHVQVGPFSNRKDADAMRQRLLADGFNAIIK